MALADSAHELSEPDEGTVLDGAPPAAVTVELLGPLRRVLRHANLQQTVLRAFPLQAPRGVPFFVRLGLVEKADPDQFAATADGWRSSNCSPRTAPTSIPLDENDI